MTDEELKELVAENNEQWRILREESASQRQESARQQQESEKRWQEYREESARQRQESARQRQESEKRWQKYREESARLWQEILASRAESDRLITSFNRELGRLGNKIGDYTESLLRPSLRRVMLEQFEMTTIIAPLSMERHGETLQIDLVAHGESATDPVYVVEMKSTLRPDAFDQLYEHMRKLPRFFPEHRGKKLFGVLAALDIPEELRIRALKEGVYLGTIKDDVFEIVPPDDFVPRAFGLRGLG